MAYIVGLLRLVLYGGTTVFIFSSFCRSEVL